MTTSESPARRHRARLSAARGAAGTVCALTLASALTGCGSDSGGDAGGARASRTLTFG